MLRKLRIEWWIVAAGCALVLYWLFAPVHHAVPAEVDPRPRPLGAPLIVRAREPTASVSGHVWTRERKPIVGAHVCALRASVDPTAVGTQSCTTSGADGRFRVSGLRAENYRVVASAAGFAARPAVETERVSLQPDSERSGVEIYLDRDGVKLSGQVLDATGGPVPGARVRVVRWQTPPLVAFVETDQSGRFSTWTSAGELTLNATWPADRTRDASRTLQAMIESDERVHFDAVPAARYFALVSCPGHRQQEGSELVEVGDADVEGLVFRVEQSPTLALRAVDEANQPRCGCSGARGDAAAWALPGTGSQSESYVDWKDSRFVLTMIGDREHTRSKHERTRAVLSSVSSTVITASKRTDCEGPLNTRAPRWDRAVVVVKAVAIALRSRHAVVGRGSGTLHPHAWRLHRR